MHLPPSFFHYRNSEKRFLDIMWKGKRNEIIIYSEGSNAAETIRRNFAQSSEGHNSLLYEQNSVSAANVERTSETASEE